MPLFLSSILSRYGLWIGVAGLAVVLLGVTYCVGKGDGKTAETAKQLERTVAVERTAGAADAQAADQRVKDAVTTAEQRKELDDAVKNGAPAGDQRVRTGCLILRQQGRDISEIAACRGY